MYDLASYRKAKKLNQSQIAEAVGLGQPRISRYEKGERTDYVSEKLLEAYPDIIEYEYIHIESDPPPTITFPWSEIYHIPVEAEAGFIGGETDPTRNEEIVPWFLPNFREPGYSFLIKGDSMMDTFRPNEFIVTGRKPVERFSDIVNDYVYVIETIDNILIKRVNKHSEPGMLWLHSDNEDYDSMEISWKEIRKMFKGRRHVGHNLSHRMRYE